MIEFVQVSKYYQKSWPTLDNVCLKINRGEFAVITGKSGSGKTTLLYHIYMKERPDSGKIFVDIFNSETMHKKEIPELRRRIGMVFQEFHLLSDRNVFENIALPLRLSGLASGEIKKRTFKVLAYTGLSHKMNEKPLFLSSGEKQRICIARALVNDPIVLLADEPTGNLDADNSADILRLLKNINGQGTAVILATHQPGLAEGLNCRRIHLENGRVVQDSTPA